MNGRKRGTKITFIQEDNSAKGMSSVTILINGRRRIHKPMPSRLFVLKKQT